ncbi:MAG TPA: hypothetical protein VHX38_14610 [Pseudonocardiaceae bacterium]|jgi:uncharacterized membrane protein|nr:hypothetical protein [Pseudonocardiaceae bacterium]
MSSPQESAPEGKRTRTALGLATLLGGSGMLHFARPGPFDKIVPKALPGPARRWTQLSGVAEIVIAVALAVPKTRRLGGLLAAWLFIAVFPANVQMAVDYQRAGKPLPARLAAFGRLPLQIPLIRSAFRVRNSGA